MDTSIKIDVSQRNLDRVINWIQLADSKATGLLAIWIISAAGFSSTVFKVTNSISKQDFTLASISVIFCIFCYISSAFISLFRLLKVLFPRQRSLSQLESPLYGESIVTMKEEDFIEAMEKLSEIEISKHLAKQTWRMQKVCSEKYIDLERSRIPLFTTVIFVIIYFILGGLVIS